jgi:hypothetical protein
MELRLDGRLLKAAVESDRPVPLIAVADFGHTSPEDHPKLRSAIHRLAQEYRLDVRIFATGPSNDGAMPLYDLAADRAGALLLGSGGSSAADAMRLDREISNSYGLGEYLPAPRLLRSLAVECERRGPALVLWFAGSYGWADEGWRSRQTGQGPKREFVYGSLARLGVALFPIVMMPGEREAAQRLAGPLGGHPMEWDRWPESLAALRRWRMASIGLPDSGAMLGRLSGDKWERSVLLGNPELPALGFGHTLIQVATPLSVPVRRVEENYLEASVPHLADQTEVRVELERMQEGRRHFHQRFRVAVTGGSFRIGPVSARADEGFRILVFHEASGWMGSAAGPVR